MKLISFLRVIKFGLKNFWRNIWLSLATTFVMVLTLFTISSLFVLSILGNVALDSVKEKIDISVYLKPEVKEEEISEIKNSLVALPEVKSIDFISKDKAMELFKEKHEKNTLILSSIEELESNPLQASLIVKARYPEDYSIISDLLKGDRYVSVIDKVTFEDNKTIIDKIANTTDLIKKIGIIIGIIFSLIAVVFMFNTIRLTIYAQKDEVKVMRLIGAKNWFIRMPFILEGVIYGVISSIISTLILYFILKYTSPYLSSFVEDPNFSALSYLNVKIVYIFALQLGLGVFLSIISSFIALRKYLRV